MHLVGFIITIYHGAQPPERQIYIYIYIYMTSAEPSNIVTH